MTWGRTRWEKDPDTKRKRRFLCDESEWVRKTNKELAIIDDALWNRVKQRQEQVHQASAAIREALHENARTGRGPKYLFSSLLSCGQCGGRFVIVDPKRYGCSGWLYRGTSVCNNTIKAPRKILESVLLEAIQRDLFTQEGFALFKEEVVRMLRERQQAHAPDREKTQAKLAQVESEIANLVAAIKAGILTQSTKSELVKAEGERARLQEALQAPHKKGETVARLLPDLKERFRELVANLGTIAGRNVDKARSALKGLLSAQISLHPCADGQERYLTAEVSGNYAGLLRLAGVQNKFGGGQGS